jgi:hypothetical protein
MLPNATEEQWLRADETLAMDARWIAKHDPRKWHLFAAACCRRVLVLGPDPLLASMIEAAEEFADGLKTWKEMTTLRKRFREEFQLPPGIRTPALKVAFGLSHAVEHLTRRVAYNAQRVTEPCTTAAASGSTGDWTEAYRKEQSAQAALARDIFGNPFRPVAFLPEWRTSTVVSLAKAMYESRDFAAMPLLADALQDAGCEQADILEHCRGTGPHVRGCWVVDHVLEKCSDHC